MIRIDWKPIVLRGGGAGALLGLWTGLWVVGFLVLLGEGMVHPGIGLPGPESNYLSVSPETVLTFIDSFVHLDWPVQPGPFLLWLIAVFAVIGAAIVGFARLVSHDPESIGLRSFVWALRSLLRWPAILLCVSSIAAIVVAILTEDAATLVGTVFFFGTSLSIFLLAFIVIPAVVCQPEVAAPPGHAAHWWSWTWPGTSVMAVFLGIGLFAFGLGYLQSLVPASWVLVPVFSEVALLVIATLAGFAQARLLFSASSSGRMRWRSVIRSRGLGSWISLELWTFTIPLVCAGPFLAAYLWLWKVVPVLASILEGSNRTFPFLYQVAIPTMTFIGRFWWLLAMVPTSLLFWFAATKLMWLVDSESEMANQRPGGSNT